MVHRTLVIFFLIGLLMSAVGWAASYYDLSFSFGAGHRNIRLKRGCFYVSRIHGEMPSGYSGYGPTDFYMLGFKDYRTEWYPKRFRYQLSVVMVQYTDRIPLSNLMLLLALPLLLQRLPIVRRSKRRNLGLCVRCRYNLTGLSQSRCPECGTPFDEKLLKKDDRCSARP